MSATIVVVTKVEPMTGYDAIELATVLGWRVVVKRGDFKVGDLAVYYSIGSCLPNEGETAFLGGKPLRTKKFKEYISQGLLMPTCSENQVEGLDVSEFLHVRKYIPPEEKELYEEDVAKAPWCGLVPKTEEERAQNCMTRITELVGRQITILRKMDGTSFTAIYLLTEDGTGRFMVCNRNHILLKETGNSRIYLQMARKYDMENEMRALGRNLAIQAEIIGPKINSNRHGVSDRSMWVFNIYDIDAKCYMSWADVVELCGRINLIPVPELYRGPIMEEHMTIDGLMAIADADRLPNGRISEGIVMKTIDNGPRMSCKVISNEYILKYKL